MSSPTSPCSTIPPKRHFNSNHPKYRCWCGGKCHVRTGAMFVGSAQIIIFSFLIIGCIVWFVYDGYRKAHQERYGLNRPKLPDHPKFLIDLWSIICLSISLGCSVILLITIALLFTGIIRERPCLLWPNLIALIIILIILTVLLVYSIVLIIFHVENIVRLADGGATNDDDRWRDAIKLLILDCVQIVACFIAMAVFTWFFPIIQRCRGYLRDSRKFEKTRYSWASTPNSTIKNRNQTLIIETGGLLAGVKHA